jgi:hypothetical protein
MFNGVSKCIPTVSILYFGLFNPFHYCLLPFTSHPHIFQQLSVHILISSTFIDVMFYGVANALLFSFPFPPFLSSIEYCHYYKLVIHISLYMIMYVFVYMFIYLTHMKENMWLFSFWTWLMSLNMMSFNCIHLSSNYMTSLFLMAK